MVPEKVKVALGLGMIVLWIGLVMLTSWLGVVTFIWVIHHSIDIVGVLLGAMTLISFAWWRALSKSMREALDDHDERW